MFKLQTSISVEFIAVDPDRHGKWMLSFFRSINGCEPVRCCRPLLDDKEQTISTLARKPFGRELVSLAEQILSRELSMDEQSDLMQKVVCR